MSNYLHWQQSLQGRVKNIESRADKYSDRLSKELAAGTLPFIDMPFCAELESELPRVMDAVMPGCRHMLLLGIGGSALGARALQKAFMPSQDWPKHDGSWLWIADNIDAESMDAWLERLNPRETLVVVISKSGGTIETMSQYFLTRDWLIKSVGGNWSNHVLAITDENSGALRQEVAQNKLHSLPVPNNLGGRYSVLSAVGLVAAYFCGMDWRALLRGAKGVTETLAKDPKTLANHPAWHLACWAKECMDANYSQLIFFSYIPSWACFGAWFCQLWAESLGKSGKGSMPLQAVGVTDQHSLLQMFLDGPRDKSCLFLESENLPRGKQFDALPEKWSYLNGQHFGDILSAEAIGTLGTMAASEIPLVRISIGQTNEESAGALIALLELATLFSGWLLGVNPLDQPAVEYGKRLANARLGAAGYDAENAALENYFAVPDEPQAF